ncbi:hypothetical protein HYR54_17475 [Candidatus Acetothermia bacterium]|nr:hypothetical protein [Candidatus Acetothermia bacterium]
MKPDFVYHFSEDPLIKIFRPHIPTTRTDAEPLVWAIDEAHAPLYWFPRDCPRITFWIGPETPPEAKARFFGHTSATRVHAIESVWLDRIKQTKLYAYRLSSDTFEPYGEADGHWVSRQEVVPLAIEPVGDLLARHAEAGIELRVTPSLWPLHDAIPNSGLRFSMVRMRNALPRP